MKRFFYYVLIAILIYSFIFIIGIGMDYITQDSFSLSKENFRYPIKLTLMIFVGWLFQEWRKNSK